MFYIIIYVLVLFGLGFLRHHRWIHIVGALLGSLFFLSKGWHAVGIAALLGIIAMEIGGFAATKLQQFGTDVQASARSEFGNESLAAAFVVGLTLGLVWVPCAGPALGFALALVRDEPGLQAFLLLLVYGIGASLPLLLIGLGGQAIAQRFRAINPYTGLIKQIAGALLIIAAIAFQFRWFETLQLWFVERTGYGTLAERIEGRLFGPAPSDSTSSTGMQSTLPKITRAPELTGLGPWHNSEPLTMAGLKGKVVLVDFWTYSCINCIRTLPYIRGYWDKYGSMELTTGKEQPFVLLGIHTPEFTFEKSQKNVADAIARHQLTYPIAQDNDFGTWRAFANRYWPAKYLIDAEGYIRYTHFGEGAYEETDKAIASLLAEIGATATGSVEMPDEPAASRLDRSAETYLGSRSWPALGNGGLIPTDRIVNYGAPDQLILHRYYLDGSWQLRDEERQTLVSDEGEIRMRFLGSEMNLVLGLDDGATSVEGEVLIDGKPTQTFTVDRHDLYNLFKGDYGEHDMILRLKGKGVAGYAFTFGA